MILRKFQSIILYLILIFSNTSLAFSSANLKDFEDVISKSNINKKTFYQHKYGYHSFLDQFIFDAFAEIFIWSFLYGGAASFHRISDEQPNLEIETREYGEPLLPFIRFDSHYQWLKNSSYGIDNSLEAGFGPFAFKFRKTDFHEELRNENDQLNFIQLEFLYRISYNKFFEMDFAVGSLKIKGNETNSGTLFSLPVMFYPTKFFGIEFTPAWSKVNGHSINDYDICASVTTGFFSLKTGYRSVSVENETLNGPYIGIACFF